MVMEKRSKNKTKEKKRSRESFSVPVVKNDAIEDDLEIQLTLTTELIKKKVKISDDLESSIDEDANQIYFEKSEQTEMITLQEQKQAINVQESTQDVSPSSLPKSEPIPIKSEPSKTLPIANSKRGGKDWRKKSYDSIHISISPNL